MATLQKDLAACRQETLQLKDSAQVCAYLHFLSTSGGICLNSTSLPIRPVSAAPLHYALVGADI